jgi:hypothetical protein
MYTTDLIKMMNIIEKHHGETELDNIKTDLFGRIVITQENGIKYGYTNNTVIYIDLNGNKHELT